MVKKIVPQETYRIIQELMNTDTLHANISYNILYMDVLIDHEGNYLNVSFKMSDQLIKRLTEEQLQQIHDAFIVAKKVDLAVMEITNMGSYQEMCRVYACQSKEFYKISNLIYYLLNTIE